MMSAMRWVGGEVAKQTRPLALGGMMTVLAIIGVVVLAQFTEPGEPPGPDGIMRVGSCVTIEPNGDAREVLCTDDPAVDRRVVAFVPFDGVCPTGALPHRDRQGMGVACVSLGADPAE